MMIGLYAMLKLIRLPSSSSTDAEYLGALKMREWKIGSRQQGWKMQEWKNWER